MAKESGWRAYSHLTRRQRISLANRARKGDAEALAKFNSYSKSIRETTNRRLRELEKAGLDYGPAYNNIIYYLQTEFDGLNRVPTPKRLNNSFNEIRWLNDFAIKFLRSPLSTVKGQEKSNYYRVKKLQEYEVLPTKVTDDNGNTRTAEWREFDDFLRFLGSEEISTAIDDYGESDVVVDMLWDYWNKSDESNKGSNLLLMKKAMARYNAKEKDFANAMREVGVKIENYRSNR